jgi:hypothetical protein
VHRQSLRRSVRREMAEGLRWVYRHRVLGPLAWSTHVWFFAKAAALTVLAILVLRTLNFSPFLSGLRFAGQRSRPPGPFIQSLGRRHTARRAPGAHRHRLCIYGRIHHRHFLATARGA